MPYFTAGEHCAFEALMQEVPGFDHQYDSGSDGILPECRSCRFHRPAWRTKKRRTCVYEYCPYCMGKVSTRWPQENESEADNGKEE